MFVKGSGMESIVSGQLTQQQYENRVPVVPENAEMPSLRKRRTLQSTPPPPPPGFVFSKDPSQPPTFTFSQQPPPPPSSVSKKDPPQPPRSVSSKDPPQQVPLPPPKKDSPRVDNVTPAPGDGSPRVHGPKPETNHSGKNWLIGIVIVAVLFWLALPVLWPASEDQLMLVRRLPMDNCFPISKEGWHNGTTLDYKITDITDTLQRYMRAREYDGLSASHLGVPSCIMMIQPYDGAPLTMINTRIVGESQKRTLTKETSSLCPDNQQIYQKRHELIVVRYRRVQDYEELEREFSGSQAYIIQQLLDAQSGVNVCN